MNHDTQLVVGQCRSMSPLSLSATRQVLMGDSCVHLSIPTCRVFLFYIRRQVLRKTFSNYCCNVWLIGWKSTETSCAGGPVACHWHSMCPVTRHYMYYSLSDLVMWKCSALNVSDMQLYYIEHCLCIPCFCTITLSSLHVRVLHFYCWKCFSTCFCLFFWSGGS